jgi:1-acyl-sn-glycerol-3-phosphate acyltransferase
VFHWWRTVFLVRDRHVVPGRCRGVSFSTGPEVCPWLRPLWSRFILDDPACRFASRPRCWAGKTYIFVSNHQSIYDIPIIFASLPFQVRIIAKASLGSFPFLGWHLRRTGHLLVDRRRPDRAGILRRWRGLVSNGLSLIIFPEGTRSADGTVGRFRAGSFMLAIEAGLSVVPVSIVGTRHVMRKGRLTVEPGDVALAIHRPIDAAARAEHPSIDDARILAADVRAAISSRVEAIERARGTWTSA